MRNSVHGAALSAREWLATLAIPATDLRQHMRRLLAIWASEIIRNEHSGLPKNRFSMASLHLPAFVPSDFEGDPALAVMVCVSLLKHRITHEGLLTLVAAYTETLTQSVPAPEADIALIVYAARRCGFSLLEPLKTTRVLATASQLITMDRKAIFEFCRRVMMASACGARSLAVGDLASVLPPLTVSFAMEWDIQTVCTLTQACSYLGFSSDTRCQWARDWLLEQQCTDGRFGLFAPAAARMSESGDDWELYFDSTVNTLMTLAELHRPGYMLSPEGKLKRKT